MPILDRLGASDSRLGNMSLGEGTTYSGNVYDKTVSQSLTLSQTVARVTTLLRSVSLSLSSLSDVAFDVHRGRGNAVNTLTLIETVGVAHTWVIGVGQSIFIGQSLDDNASFQRTLTQPLTLTQNAAISRPLTITQSLTFLQTATVLYSKFAVNSLALSHTVGLSKTLGLSVESVGLLVHFNPHSFTQDRGFVETIRLSKTLNIGANSLLAPSESVSDQISHAHSASNTLSLSQEMYQIRTNESDTSPLVISQAVTVKKIKNISVAHVLTFGNHTSVNGTPIKLSVTQTLVFKQSHDRPTGIPSYPIVTIPSGYVVKVPDVRPPDPCYPYRGTLTLLEIPGASVILPTAEFNDSQSYNGRVSIKRAMNGRRRVYHRKMGIAQKLHYDFIIDRRKAIELRQFIIQANSIPIKLTNWKGEVWQVLLTNSPLTFTEESYWGPGSGASSGNKSSISLEFEGARIN